MEMSYSQLYLNGMVGLDGMGLVIIGGLCSLRAPSVLIIAAIL